MQTLSSPSRPPRWWEALTWFTLLATVAYFVSVVANAAILWQDFALLDQLVTDPDSIVSDEVLRQISTAETVSRITFALLVLELLAVIAWTIAVGRVLRGSGLDARRTVRHWALIGWRVGIALSFVMTFLVLNGMSVASVEAATRYDRVEAVLLGIRMIMTILLAIGVVSVARRVATAVANANSADLAGVPGSSATNWSPPVADETFWSSVATMAVRDERTPLLVASSSGNRWHLLSSDVDVTAVRSGLAPDSTVIVYSTPPEPVDAKVLGRIAGRVRARTRVGQISGSVGLIDDGTTVHYGELFTEAQLTAWLEHARSAIRVGVYPTAPAEDPGSLSAVVPHAMLSA